MTDYNVQINKFDQTQADYDKLFPMTKTANIQGFVPYIPSSMVVISIVPALAGVTCTLTGASSYSAISDAGGVATINNVALGQYAITFSSPDVSMDDPNVNVQFYGVYSLVAKNVQFYGVYSLVAKYATYKTYTVQIDETNSNPLTCCVYQDDAVGMTKGSSDWDTQPIFKDIKPCVLNAGTVAYYLNPDNYAQKADGTASVITGADGDVMVEFSKYAYRIYREGNYLYVSITDNPDAVTLDSRWSFGAFSRDALGDRDKMYIGAYHGCVLGDPAALRSVSGKTPAINFINGTFRTWAQANGTGYQQFGFYQLTALQCLYLIKYGNLNSQEALGMGYVGGSAAKVSGSTDASGMYYGTTSSTQSVKFAGIEDFWGNIYDWIDGLYCSASWNVLTAFSGFNDTGSGYTNNGTGATAVINGYITKTQGINSNTGFVIKTAGGSASTYYTDDGGLNTASIPYFGGAWSSGPPAGVFSLNVYISASTARTTVGSRLTYC